MQMSSLLRRASLLAAIALVAACNKSSSSQKQNAQPAALVALSGCIEEAPGTHNYVLHHVRFEGRVGDPQATTTTPGSQGITEGSWVRLDGTDKDLSGYLGRHVRLNGVVSDNGRNTIGTAGTSGVQTPSGDKSQASSEKSYPEKESLEMGRIGRESMANGTAAEIRVREVSPTGERCEPEPSK
jgi:hypothetical protein